MPGQKKQPSVPAESDATKALRPSYSELAAAVKASEDTVKESRRLLDALYQRRQSDSVGDRLSEGEQVNPEHVGSVREDDSGPR